MPPAPFDGRVHSLFETAANLEINGLEPLVTLYTSAAVDLPQGIRLRPLDFNTGSINPGQPAWARDGRLMLPGLVVDLRGARSGKHGLDGEPLDLARAGSRQACAWLASELARRQDAAAQPAGGLAQRLSVGLTQLEGSVRRLDVACAQRAALTLVGLGQGLTPSGDDMLLGFYAGLRACAGKHPPQQAFLERFCEILEQVSSRTNDISRTYLLLSARGQFSSSLVELVEALSRGEQGASLQRAARVVLDTGHTSGCDTAAGLLAGLSSFAPREKD